MSAIAGLASGSTSAEGLNLKTYFQTHPRLFATNGKIELRLLEEQMAHNQHVLSIMPINFRCYIQNAVKLFGRMDISITYQAVCAIDDKSVFFSQAQLDEAVFSQSRQFLESFTFFMPIMHLWPLNTENERFVDRQYTAHLNQDGIYCITLTSLLAALNDESLSVYGVVPAGTANVELSVGASTDAQQSGEVAEQGVRTSVSGSDDVLSGLAAGATTSPPVGTSTAASGGPSPRSSSSVMSCSPFSIKSKASVVSSGSIIAQPITEQEEKESVSSLRSFHSQSSNASIGRFGNVVSHCDHVACGHASGLMATSHSVAVGEVEEDELVVELSSVGGGGSSSSSSEYTTARGGSSASSGSSYLSARGSPISSFPLESDSSGGEQPSGGSFAGLSNPSFNLAASVAAYVTASEAHSIEFDYGSVSATQPPSNKRPLEQSDDSGQE